MAYSSGIRFIQELGKELAQRKATGTWPKTQKEREEVITTAKRRTTSGWARSEKPSKAAPTPTAEPEPTELTRQQALERQRRQFIVNWARAFLLEKKIQKRITTIEKEAKYTLPLSYFVPSYKGEGTRILTGEELIEHERGVLSGIREYQETSRQQYIQNISNIKQYPEEVRGVPVKYIPTETGYDVKMPSYREIHEHLYPGEKGQARIAAGITQEWGIPTIVSLGISYWMGVGPTGKMQSLAKGIETELERQAEKSVRLTIEKGESAIDYTKRFWTSPEAIENVYVPIATIGIGEAYTLVKGGATGAITTGKLADIGAKYGTKATKTFERGLLGAGIIGASISGASIGYTYATTPEYGPSAIGQVAKGWITSFAGFKLGETIVRQKFGISTPKPIEGVESLKRADTTVRKLDIDLTKDIPRGVIEPINKETAQWQVIWKPKEPMYGIQEIRAGGLATSKGTQPVDIVFSKGRAMITYAPKKTGLTWTQTIKIRPMDVHGVKIAVTGAEYSIPFKSIQTGETIDSYLVSKTYGVIGKKGYPSTVEFELLSGKYIKSHTETIPAKTHPMWSRGRAIGVSKPGFEKVITVSEIKQAMTISVIGEKAFFGKDISSFDTITSDVGVSPGALKFAQQTKFKFLTKLDIIGATLTKYATGQSMATATLRGVLPSLVSIQRLEQIYQIEKFQKVGELEIQRFGRGEVIAQKVGGEIVLQKLGETQLQNIGKVTIQKMQQVELQKMEMQKLQEIKTQKMQQMEMQKLQQTKLQGMKIPAIDMPPIPIITETPSFEPPPIPLGGIYGRGTRGFDWNLRQQKYKFRKAKIGLPFASIKKILKEVKL